MLETLNHSVPRSPESDTPDTGGANATTHPLTIGQRLSAALASKASMQADLVKFQARITELEAQAAELAQAKTRIAELESQAAEFEEAISRAEREVALAAEREKTVDQAAQEKISSLGFPAQNLPPADDNSSAAETLDDLRTSMASAKSATEKQEIMKKIRALR